MTLSKEMEATMSFKSYWTLVLIVALCLMPAGIQAQDLGEITCINHYYHNWQAGVYDVDVSGDYAYLACGDEGMRILNISNPGAITEIGQVDYQRVKVLTVADSYAYVGSDYSAVNILDIATPEAPQQVGFIEVGGYLQAIQIESDYAFICTLGDGLVIADISNRAQPEIIWNSPGISSGCDVAIQGNFAYVGTCYSGLLEVDISNPASPVMARSFLPTYEEVNGVAVAGNYAYLASGNSGFQVVDLTTMQLAASLDSLYYSFKVEVNGNYAYLSYGDFECPLGIIDISNPLSPQVTGNYYPPQDMVNFAVIDDLAYVADFEHCLRVVDISDPTQPYEAYSYLRYGQDRDVTVVGDYAYVKEDCALKVINIADMEHPFEVGYYEMHWFKSELIADGDVGFVAQAQNPCLVAVDLAHPDPLTILGTYDDTGYYPHEILAVYDHHAYLNYSNGLKIIDASDPANMHDVRFYNDADGIYVIAISDNGYAFCQGLHRYVKVLDLTDPADPVEIASYQVGDHLYDMQCADGKLYAISFANLYVFSATDFDQWAPLAEVEMSQAINGNMSGIEIQDEFAYVIDYQHGLHVFDITDAAAPQLLGFIETPGDPFGLDAIGDTVVIADRTNLGFYDCSPVITEIKSAEPVLPERFSLLPNYPNPFNSSTNIQFELPAPGHLSLMIFDILGRNVATLADGEFPAGRHIINWDGRDSQGQSVASGRYYVRAKAADELRTAPVLLLK